MSDQIQYTFAVEVGSEIEVSDKQTIEIDGYSKNRVTIPDGDSKVLTDAFPIANGSAEDIKFILMTADEYEGLEYAFKKDNGGWSYQGFDQPFILATRGAIDSVGIENEDISFKNGAGEERTVQVIVGRSTS